MMHAPKWSRFGAERANKKPAERDEATAIIRADRDGGHGADKGR
jgi:hypothetical protein